MTVKRQLAIDLVEIFEDLLEEHGIIVPDPDREYDNDTPLYGCTWANLVDDVEEKILSFLSNAPAQNRQAVADTLNSELIHLDIQKFLEEFNLEYNFLYENNDNVAGFHEAVQYGDKFIAEHPNFIRQFNEYRHDPITSDREVAAFAFTLDKMS